MADVTTLMILQLKATVLLVYRRIYFRDYFLSEFTTLVETCAFWDWRTWAGSIKSARNQTYS